LGNEPSTSQLNNPSDVSEDVVGDVEGTIVETAAQIASVPGTPDSQSSVRTLPEALEESGSVATLVGLYEKGDMVKDEIAKLDNLIASMEKKREARRAEKDQIEKLKKEEFGRLSKEAAFDFWSERWARARSKAAKAPVTLEGLGKWESAHRTSQIRS